MKEYKKPEFVLVLFEGNWILTNDPMESDETIPME